MHPSLFDIPVLGDSYFFMVGMGFVLATAVLLRFARLHDIEGRLMIDFVVWMLVFGLIGSRLLHVIADGHFMDYVNVCLDPAKVDWRVDWRECTALAGLWDETKKVCHPAQVNCLAWADLTAGGFAFYGGFIAAALFAIRFVRRHHLPAGKLIDIGSVLLMLGLCWGRMGCLLAGCCFGARCDHCDFSLVFPPRSPASRMQWEEGLLTSYRLESLPVLPTQIYEAASGLAIAAIAYFWLHPRKRFDGQVFCFAVAAYAVARFAVEFWRRDERGGFLGLSTSQLIAVGFLGVSVWLYRKFSRAAATRKG